MTPGGQRDRTVVIERRSGAERDAYGEPLDVWTQLVAARARVRVHASSERLQAGGEGAHQRATFMVLATPGTRGIVPGDRAVCDGSTWDITGIVPDGRREIAIEAERVI